tara:strand:+ start:3044 stop:4447 length:1404 start_codon:yes stop_codon:yes gene_type:complete
LVSFPLKRSDKLIKGKGLRINIILLFVFFACSKNNSSENSLGIDEILESFEEYSQESSHSSDYIYDQNKLHRFDLYLSELNLDKIDSAPADEKYVEGSLVFENRVIKKVGIRYKGSIGAWVGCLSSSDWTNPSGFKTCPKLSMKIKINWLSGDETFYGLKKLQFHSQNLDDSKMHERLGYWMFRSFGVTAPRSNHAVLYINGEFNGLFANTENIDGPFTNKHFEDGDGNLYKEVWPINNMGGVNSESYFKKGLKTNEEMADVSKILKFGSEVENVSETDLNALINSWIDKDLFLKTILVDRRIAHDDGFLHWYNDEDDTYSNHNYYWYEDPNNDKVQLIPWDLDNAFENIASDRNPVTPIKDQWNETSSNCSGFRYGPLQIKQRSAACDKIIGSYSIYKDRYDELDLIFKQQYFNLPKINSLLSEWSDQIETEVQKANNKFPNDEVSVFKWKQAVRNLKSDIESSLK